MEDDLNRLAGEVFTNFARFEYALKAAGFHKGDGAAEPNWRSFAESVSGLFDNLSDPDLSAAVQYILAPPPKKPIIDQGQLDWAVAAPNTNLRPDFVLPHLRRDKHNLFHSGQINRRVLEPQPHGRH